MEDVKYSFPPKCKQEKIIFSMTYMKIINMVDDGFQNVYFPKLDENDNFKKFRYYSSL